MLSVRIYSHVLIKTSYNIQWTARFLRISGNIWKFLQIVDILAHILIYLHLVAFSALIKTVPLVPLLTDQCHIRQVLPKPVRSKRLSCK